jgi:glutathione S-transferase
MGVHDASDETTRADIEALPGHLERIEGALADGVIGGELPNAADLQIAPSVGLLLTLEDVRPLVEHGRAADWARGLFPAIAGRLPAGTLPAGRAPV